MAGSPAVVEGRSSLDMTGPSNLMAGALFARVTLFPDTRHGILYEQDQY